MDNANELLRRCQRRDEAAIAIIIEQFEHRVFRLAFRMLGDAHRAEEAAADTFVKVWSGAKQWREEADAGTWIYRIAFRTTLDHRRRKRWFWQSPPADLPDPRPDPLERSMAKEGEEHLARRTREAMSQLSDGDRAIIHLFYFEELSLARVAEIVEADRDVVKTRLVRARWRLKELLGDREATGPESRG